MEKKKKMARQALKQREEEKLSVATIFRHVSKRMAGEAAIFNGGVMA